MRRALVDHSTLSSVQRLLGDAPTYSLESVDADITALEGFIHGVLFWDKQFSINDYKQTLREGRSKAFSFMQYANDLPGFDCQAFASIAEECTQKFLVGFDECGLPDPNGIKALLEVIESEVSVNWNHEARTSEYFLSIRLLQSLAKAPTDKYGVAESLFYSLMQKPGSAFLVEGRVLGERLWSELADLAQSVNWLASRTAYYSAVADALGLELILHPIRHDFRIRLIESLFPTNQGLFDSVFEKLKASAKDTIGKVFMATDPVIAKLNLPLFTAVLAARTEDPRKFIVEAQHMAQEGACRSEAATNSAR